LPDAAQLDEVDALLRSGSMSHSVGWIYPYKQIDSTVSRGV